MTNQGQYKIVTNQGQYDLVWEKAKKYDRFVGVLDEIREEIESHIIDSNGLDFNSALCIAIEIIDKHRTECEGKE